MRNVNARITDLNDFVSCSGDKYHVIYSPIVNADGTITLKETGKDDIQEMINSYRDQTDMSFILAAMAAGDTSVLSQKEPMYGDFTKMPKTYAEALQMVIDAEDKFYDLPADIRNKFDNDYKQWFAQAGSADWLEKMNYDPESKEDTVEEKDNG